MILGENGVPLGRGNLPKAYTRMIMNEQPPSSSALILRWEQGQGEEVAGASVSR